MRIVCVCIRPFYPLDNFILRQMWTLAPLLYQASQLFNPLGDEEKDLILRYFSRKFEYERLGIWIRISVNYGNSLLGCCGILVVMLCHLDNIRIATCDMYLCSRVHGCVVLPKHVF